ncbi:MAG: permease-like cell division protein FtsX [Bacteroidales bacterium]|nr:permease-like cell division protein FtsX [Bacteroidales bacterium]
MATRKKENKTLRRRLWGSRVSTVISISLVLVLLGAAMLVLLNARAVGDWFKERMQVSVILKESVSEDAAKGFQAVLDSLPYVRTTEYVSREQGVQEMQELLGEDFMDAFAVAPVPVSIDVCLHAQYVSADSLQMVSDAVKASPLVDEVVYQASLVDSLNENLGRMTLVSMILIALLLFISVVLIGNTVRLSMFSKRFSVHTMRLVGATRGFIRRPFLARAALQGTVAAFIALAVLAAGLYFLDREFAPVLEIFSREILILVALSVLAAGIVLCVGSAFLVAGKMIDMSNEELYS